MTISGGNMRENYFWSIAEAQQHHRYYVLVGIRATRGAKTRVPGVIAAISSNWTGAHPCNSVRSVNSPILQRLKQVNQVCSSPLHLV